MLEVCCVAVGMKGDEFYVTVAPDAKSSALKTEISSSKDLAKNIPANRMILYRAKQGGVANGRWVTRPSEVVGIADPKQLAKTRQTYSKPDLQISPRFPLKQYFGDQAEPSAVHMLIEAISMETLPPGVDKLSLTSELKMNNMTTYTAIKKEIENVEKWKTGIVHDIPAISAFIEPFGGCGNGKIYWREEEKQVLSLLLEHMLENKKKCIIHGAPGVGKSTLLCLATLFYNQAETRAHVSPLD